jgi:hypothetical protein
MTYDVKFLSDFFMTNNEEEDFFIFGFFDANLTLLDIYVEIRDWEGSVIR